MPVFDSSFHPDQPVNLLLIYPAFPEIAFWNWTDVCRAVGRKAMGMPLGLLTFAATLPASLERAADGPEYDLIGTSSCGSGPTWWASAA